MIISKNNKADHSEFEILVEKVIEKLNVDAMERAEYYVNRGGVKLEKDVFRLLKKEAKGTVFEGTIEMVSGQKFPDIVANNYYGIEVKTTKNKTWTSTGSSIVESTRVDGVEKIYLLFGKLSHPIGFKIKPYESCLSDIVVTHSPRYKIDMNLEDNETIFEKMNVDYNQFRLNENSIDIVKGYYKSNLKPGQNLWWIDSEPVEEQAVSPIIKLWNTLTIEEKQKLQVKGFCWFPEIFGNSTNKFNRLAIWLVTHKGVVATSLRDTYTAGGKRDIATENNLYEEQPQIIYKANQLKKDIILEITNADLDWIKEFWGVSLKEDDDRLKVWIDCIAAELPEDDNESLKVLYDIFNYREHS